MNGGVCLWCECQDPGPALSYDVGSAGIGAHHPELRRRSGGGGEVGDKSVDVGAFELESLLSVAANPAAKTCAVAVATVVWGVASPGARSP